MLNLMFTSFSVRFKPFHPNIAFNSDGSTDVTRTVHFGTPTERQKVRHRHHVDQHHGDHPLTPQHFFS
jgi:hypothetical protein